MAGEKNFENRLKRWLEEEGIYPLGHPSDKMPVAPYGYYEKRWGGGRFQKSGLPDMRIVVNGIALEVELKDTHGTPSELQKHNIRQINRSMGFGFILYPEGFSEFQKIVKVVKTCPPNVPIVTAFTLIMVWRTNDLSPLEYLIPAVFAELAAATGFYYSKAKAENRIKLRKIYGAEIYNDAKEP